MNHKSQQASSNASVAMLNVHQAVVTSRSQPNQEDVSLFALDYIYRLLKKKYVS